jgi:DNA-binding NarL/FixJ family response regulator
VTAKRKLLIVDDHREVRQVLKTLFEAEGRAEVVGSAGTGREAIALARKLRPDIVVTDVDLPDIDGLAAAASIRADLPDVRVVVLSIHDESSHADRAREAGVSAWVTKGTPAPLILEAVFGDQPLGEPEPEPAKDVPDAD